MVAGASLMVVMLIAIALGFKDTASYITSHVITDSKALNLATDSGLGNLTLSDSFRTNPQRDLGCNLDTLAGFTLSKPNTTVHACCTSSWSAQIDCTFFKAR